MKQKIILIGLLSSLWLWACDSKIQEPLPDEVKVDKGEVVFTFDGNDVNLDHSHDFGTVLVGEEISISLEVTNNTDELAYLSSEAIGSDYGLSWFLSSGAEYVFTDGKLNLEAGRTIEYEMRLQDLYMSAQAARQFKIKYELTESGIEEEATFDLSANVVYPEDSFCFGERWDRQATLDSIGGSYFDVTLLEEAQPINWWNYSFAGKMWFYAGRNIDEALVATSEDGLSWIESPDVELTGLDFHAEASGVVFGGKMWAFGRNHDNGFVMGAWSSTDGIAWSYEGDTNIAEYSAGSFVAELGGTLYYYANYSGSVEAYQSNDGLTWTSFAFNAADFLPSRVVNHNDRLYAFHGGADMTAHISDDGINWTKLASSQISNEYASILGFSFEGKLYQYVLRAFDTKSVVVAITPETACD